MKKLLLASTMTILTITSAFTAPVAQANVAQTLCEYVAADNKVRMRKFLKKNRIKIRSVFDDIKCNGQNLLVFAQTAKAVDVGSLVISQLPKDTVSAQLALLKSGTPLFEAANKRVSS